MKIQLDTNAMNALFPEGSEARVQLQNAVVANYASRVKDKFISEDVLRIVQLEIGKTLDDAQIRKLTFDAMNESFEEVARRYQCSTFKVRSEGEMGKALDKFITEKAYQQRQLLQDRSQVLSKDILEKHTQSLIDTMNKLIENQLAKAEKMMQETVTQNFSAIVRNELKKFID